MSHQASHESGISVPTILGEMNEPVTAAQWSDREPYYVPRSAREPLSMRLLIFKSIGVMYSLQIFRMHVEAVQSERWSLPDRHSAYMAPCIFSMGYVRLHHVAGLKSHEMFAPRSILFGKAVFVCCPHLTRPMPGRFDLQRLNVGDVELLRSTLSDTGRVNPVRLRQASSRSIELRQSA